MIAYAISAKTPHQPTPECASAAAVPSKENPAESQKISEAVVATLTEQRK